MTENRNRILARLVARELTAKELGTVAGGLEDKPYSKQPFEYSTSSVLTSTNRNPFTEADTDGGADD